MNTKRFLLLLGIALAMMLAVSCSDDTNTGPYETDEFYYHGSDSFKVINASEHDITGVTIRTWDGADSTIIEYNELISKKGGSKSLLMLNEVLPRNPLMCIKAENRPKLDCIRFNSPSYTWDGKDLYITRLPHPLEMEAL
ncbi:MAG: hypothetical protein LBU89_07715 [Fibromonadaceae bacterium]|jgi:hypothetical protein|nr:hypothetical protein [Fibromonadaceae bacterium]